jgi:hypothetical protein
MGPPALLSLRRKVCCGFVLLVTDERILISAEMRFLRRTAGHSRWDHKRNEDILTELQMLQITERNTEVPGSIPGHSLGFF